MQRAPGARGQWALANWNDPAIAALNPNVKLPDAAIAVVRRADDSGTSFIWTHYLAQVNPEWKSKVVKARP